MGRLVRKKQRPEIQRRRGFVARFPRAAAIRPERHPSPQHRRPVVLPAGERQKNYAQCDAGAPCLGPEIKEHAEVRHHQRLTARVAAAPMQRQRGGRRQISRAHGSHLESSGTTPDTHQQPEATHRLHQYSLRRRRTSVNTVTASSLSQIVCRLGVRTRRKGWPG